MTPTTPPLLPTPTPSSSPPSKNLRRTPILYVQFVFVVFVVAVVPPSSSSAATADDFLEYYMLEELPPNSLVGSLIHDFGLDHKYSPAVLGQLRFSFLTQPNFDRPYFAIDETSGDIYITHRVDRERICARQVDCVVKFDVAVQPIQFFQIVKVKVEIVDINDNAPAFPEKRVHHQISEFAELGTGFVVPAATDLDSGRNGVHRYELLPADGKFELTVRTTADGGTDLRLVLRERLDRETEDRYVVSVLAVDGGDPAKTGSIVVNVTVQDSNDNNPHFENASYEVWVAENVPVGTVILKVRARDRDAGQNAVIVYEFSKHTAQEYGHLFGIKSETGKIYLKNNLDFESGTGAIYLLSVTANDRGPDSLPAHAAVVVRVEDVNDHAPQISVNTLTSASFAEVKENADIGTFVAHLSVVDADSGNNGKFLCAVDNQNFALQQIYASELKLVTAARLDREFRDEYDLSISCRDYGAPQSHTAVVPLRVRVADENDNWPRLDRDAYEATVTENNDVGAVLFRVSATDADAAENGDVTYRLDAELGRLMTVDARTGRISAAVAFDHEAISELDFYLTAEDRGTPARSSSARLKLTVVDVDDNRPEFTRNRYVLRVAENRPPPADVGAVTAYDRDSEPFNRFRYAIDAAASEPSAINAFDVDPHSGRITAKERLDRERQAVYHLTVVAGAEGQLSAHRRGGGSGADRAAAVSSATVTVSVTDVNDNAPVFTYPRPADNETITISSATPRGYVVARLRAVDADAGGNANLTYHLLSAAPLSSSVVPTASSSSSSSALSSSSGEGGNGGAQQHRPPPPPPHPFIVTTDGGALAVNADLSAVVRETYVLRLSVSDGGEPALGDRTELRVVVRSDVAFVDARYYSILASEDMVVVLAFTLATILMAIAIIVAIICMFRRRAVAAGSHGAGSGSAGGEKERNYKLQLQKQKQNLGNGGDDKLLLANGKIHGHHRQQQQQQQLQQQLQRHLAMTAVAAADDGSATGKATAVVNAYVSLNAVDGLTGTVAVGGSGGGGRVIDEDGKYVNNCHVTDTSLVRHVAEKLSNMVSPVRFFSGREQAFDFVQNNLPTFACSLLLFCTRNKFKNFQFCLMVVRSFVIDKTLKVPQTTVRIVMFIRLTLVALIICITAKIEKTKKIRFTAN